MAVNAARDRCKGSNVDAIALGERAGDRCGGGMLAGYSKGRAPRRVD